MPNDAATGTEQVGDHLGSSSRQGLPSISILMPTKNRIDELLETLDSITGQEHPPEEVVIIDQSTEDCGDLVRSKFASRPEINLVYIWDPEIPGLVPARDVGVARSTSEIVFFIDDDITLDLDCVGNLAQRYADNPEFAGICGVDVDGALIPWWLVIARKAYMLGPFNDDRSLTNKRFKNLKEPQPARLVSGGYISYRKSVFDEFQFEGKLWGHRWNSSIDFSYRVSAKYLVVLDPLVRVRHRIPYGTYTAEEFVRIRVAGAFFFFKRNIKKTPVGWATFSWLLLAIFLRSAVLGIQRRLFRKTIWAFFVEARKGISFLKHPFEGSY